MYPRARSAQLVIQDLPDEMLVFDQRNRKAHCLNRTTALVWRHCDGRTDLAGLARLVERGLAIADGAVVVQLALEQLASRHLLDGTVERGSAAQRRWRRETLKRLAMTAVALPAILTVEAPRANAAASAGVAGAPCGPGQVLCLGKCVTPLVPGFQSVCMANCQCENGNCAQSALGMRCCIPSGGSNPGCNSLCCSGGCDTRHNICV